MTAVLFFYVFFTLIVAAVGAGGLIGYHQYDKYHQDDDRKNYAKILLASPLWPVWVPVWAALRVRDAWRLSGWGESHHG